jgi:hypothetical protein
MEIMEQQMLTIGEALVKQPIYHPESKDFYD